MREEGQPKEEKESLEVEVLIDLEFNQISNMHIRSFIFIIH